MTAVCVVFLKGGGLCVFGVFDVWYVSSSMFRLI